MRGGAIPLLCWGTLLVVLMALNWIWTGDAIQVGTFAFAAAVVLGSGLALVLLRPHHVGGGEFHKGILAETDELVARRRAVADPRLVLERPFEVPQQREIIEPPGFSFEIPEEVHGCLEMSTVMVCFIVVCAFPCAPANA